MSDQTNTSREIVKLSTGFSATDGDGVKLTRLIGTPEIDQFDPFLLLDNFHSDNPDDYIGGFPEHPHRGFETVTYLLAGRMRHKDNAGHDGVIEAGGVQWMTAGRGILHSEIPEQEDGMLQGFQLWVNLPARQKMKKPAYQEFTAAQIPLERSPAGATVRVVSGVTNLGTPGVVKDISTDPLYLDVTLEAGASFQQQIPKSHNGFLYGIDGETAVGKTTLQPSQLAILGDGDLVIVTTGQTGGRFLLVAGQRLNEPVARRGPFVMNTREEVMQAFHDYQTGKF